MSKHGRHIPGLVNPWQMGLLGGVQGFLQGYAQDQQTQAKFQHENAIEEMKAKNNRILKLLEMDSKQREFTQHFVGKDGKVYDQLVRRTYDHQTGGFDGIVKIGDPVPSKDPLAATNALIASREKISKDTIGAANSRNAATIGAENSRNAARIAALRDPSVITAAERRNQLQQTGLNNRVAVKLANTARKEALGNFDELPYDEKQQYGFKEDPKGAKQKYADKVYDDTYEKNVKKLNAGAPAAPQPGDASDHPETTTNGQPVYINPKTGERAIKDKDGNMVPYKPTAEADGSGDAGLALDSPEAQQLAQDHPSMTGAQDDDGEPTQDTGDQDQQDQSLIAEQQQAPPPGDDEQQEPQQDDEEQEQYGGILS